MLKQCLEVFEKLLDKEGDKLILDNYVPTDGTYVIVKPKDDTFEIYDIVDICMDKKTRSIDRSSNNFNKICEMDYYSCLIDMNKPIDSKKIIHSNNYLSFFVKKDNLIEGGELDKEKIYGYYEVLRHPDKKYDKNAISRQTYLSVEKEIGKPDIDMIGKIEDWILDNIFNLPFEISGKDYLKIFFDYPIELYKKEGRRYLIPNIYNSNDFNIDFEEKIYGVPNNNMGMNSKKPFLENKSRKSKVPYLIDNDEVVLQKKFFDYLMTFAVAGRNNIYIDDKISAPKSSELLDKDFSGYFLRIQKGKEVEIRSVDTITSYKVELEKSFEYIEFINVDNEKDPDKKYGEYKNRKSLQILLDDIFFSGFLINNYFEDFKKNTKDSKKNIKDRSVKRNIIISREFLFNWFYKGISNGVYPVLKNVSMSLIKDHILEGFRSKAGKQFNMRWSIINYFKGGVNMADVIQDSKSKLRQKINSEVTLEINSDDEYFFAIGQMVSYLLSKSKGKKKPHSLAASFINANSDKKIREDLRKLFKKYSYDDSMNGRRFNNLYAMILGYEVEGEVNQDMIIAGYLNNNLLYEKKEEL